jgi:hypothetical protein
MTTLFVRSLQRLPSLQATVISNAANMAATVRSSAALRARHACAPTSQLASYHITMRHSSWQQQHTTQAIITIQGRVVLCSTTAPQLTPPQQSVSATGSACTFLLMLAC